MATYIGVAIEHAPYIQMFDHVCIYYILMTCIPYVYPGYELYIIYINHVCLDIVLFLSRHESPNDFLAILFSDILGMAHCHGLIRVKLIQIDSNDRSHRSDKIARELCGT